MLQVNIISFCETWGFDLKGFSNFLPGYSTFNCVRPKRKGAKRASGGFFVFVKDKLLHSGRFTRIFENFSDCVVLYFSCKTMHRISHDLILFFRYVSPEYSSIYSHNDDNGIELLSKKLQIVVTTYPDAHLSIVGDLKARVKDFIDYIPKDDIFNDDMQYPTDYFRKPRKSMDPAYNRLGLSLIDLCCTFNIHILNGRFPSDAAGHFICIANQGASAVDYMICSSELFNYISDFTVLDNDNSDHFPITCSITLQAETENIVANSDKMKCELFPFKRFKWRTKYSDKFKLSFISYLTIFVIIYLTAQVFYHFLVFLMVYMNLLLML